MTRRLIASGQRPVTVGTFFSLGHSTYVAWLLLGTRENFIMHVLFTLFSDLLRMISIVIITSIVVAATASAISSKFGSFSRIGGIIGTSVSASFLIILGLMNIYILYKLVQQIKKLIDVAPGQEAKFEIRGAGCLFYMFKKLFKIIDR